jgi:hypothetical protein
MLKKIPTKKERLRREDIRGYNKLIHKQNKSWLVKRFGPGRKYPINVDKTIRNIIWQTRERIRKNQRRPFEALIRSMWYSHIKPTLFRTESLAGDFDQYQQLSKMFVRLVRYADVMRYKDMGFVDENENSRKIGINHHVILFSEKEGHYPLLKKIAGETEVTIIALGGQPSVLSAEYFIDEMKEKGINIQQSFYLFSLVDYDPWGWIIRDSFIRDLKFYGVKNIKNIDLVLPAALTKEELNLAKFRIDPKDKVNRKWMAKSRGINKQFYGFEADAIPPERIKKGFIERIKDLIKSTLPIRKARNKIELAEALEKLSVLKLRM